MRDVHLTLKGTWLQRGLILAAVIIVMIPAAVSAAGGAFTDDDDSPFESNIEWLAGAGVTFGCNPPTNDQFCPNDQVTRGQMAAFMQRFAQYLGAEDGTPAQADNADTLDGRDSTDFQPAVVPAGETVYGTIGAIDYPGAGREVAANSSLPIPAPVGLFDEFVTVAGGDDDTDGACTGTSDAPTAAPGYVCMYSYSESNVDTHKGYVWGSGDGTRFGFQLSVVAIADGSAAWFGNWAYTAPLASGPAAVVNHEVTVGQGGDR